MSLVCVHHFPLSNFPHLRPPHLVSGHQSSLQYFLHLFTSSRTPRIPPLFYRTATPPLACCDSSWMSFVSDPPSPHRLLAVDLWLHLNPRVCPLALHLFIVLTHSPLSLSLRHSHSIFDFFMYLSSLPSLLITAHSHRTIMTVFLSLSVGSKFRSILVIGY